MNKSWFAIRAAFLIFRLPVVQFLMERDSEGVPEQWYQ